MRPTPLLGLLLGLLALAGCGEAAPYQARFTVRGRWPGERRIAWTLDPEEGPLGREGTLRTIRSALETWTATGCVRFQEVGPDGEAALVFAWRRGAHGPCVPFGTDTSVAHAGPPAPGTFVHFDAERDWLGPDLALRQAVLHEVGHVLGLDHSPDEAALMYPEPSAERAHLGPCDLAGIHSLYGGGRDGPGDLRVRASGTERAAGVVLRAVAPPELTDWTLFDTDGDGDSEVVVWRTDAGGNGAVWTYHFGSGPELAHTRGPLYGLVAPGLTIEFATTPEGERLLVLEPPQGDTRAWSFDAFGQPRAWDGEVPARASARAAGPEGLDADLDGDRIPEHVSRGFP